jgi:hypothetical protein
MISPNHPDAVQFNFEFPSVDLAAVLEFIADRQQVMEKLIVNMDKDDIDTWAEGKDLSNYFTEQEFVRDFGMNPILDELCKRESPMEVLGYFDVDKRIESLFLQEPQDVIFEKVCPETLQQTMELVYKQWPYEEVLSHLIEEGNPDGS